MKGAVAWFAGNHVAANLLMLFFIITGVFTALTMKLEVFPETSMDKITITAAYPGASPEEIEEAIVRRIEENVAGLAGIKRIDSTAREGVGSITIEVVSGWDVKKLTDEVKAQVDRITTFPEEIEQPIISEATISRQVISLAVYGDVPEATLKHIAEKTKDDLTNLPGITLASVSGVRSSQIHIEISEHTLRSHGLTLGQVALAVKQASFDLPAGSIKTTGGEILIRTKGRRYYAADYSNVALITRSDGTKLTLGQIADLRNGFEDVDVYAMFQGKPAALVHVFRVADQNALDVAAKVNKYVRQAKPGLPNGVKIGLYEDSSPFLKSRILLLTKNMGIGLLLVVVILGLFLNFRLAFWVTLGIPISFSAAMILLPQMDVSLNMISLFAFILVLGIVVDDAIVVGENIHRKQQQGLPRFEGSVQGALDVGRPVVFSVLTTIVAFLPLLLGGGYIGKLLRCLPIVVCLVLLASLIESLFILPAHLAVGGKKIKQKPKKEKLMSRALDRIIKGPYAKLVNFCVTWRYATVALGVFMIFLSMGILKAEIVRQTFMPDVEGDIMTCNITMPSGTSEERTLKVIEKLELAAKKILLEQDKQRPKNAKPLLEHSIAVVGLHIAGRRSRVTDNGSHLGQIWIQLIPGEEREHGLSTQNLTNLWREAVGVIEDAESIIYSSAMHSSGNAIEFHLSSNDHNQLMAAADELKAELETYPGVFDVGDSFLPGKMEMQLKLKPEAHGLDLTLNDLARQVRNAFYGAEALRMQRGRDEVKVMVRYPESERTSLGSVEEMRIITPKGEQVPFSQVAEVSMKTGYASIVRAQRQRVIKVMADVDMDTINPANIRKDISKNYMPHLLANHPGLRYTVEGRGRNRQEAFRDVYLGFGIALFAIYALLAIPFKSFTQPFVVMFAIPFGLIGALFGHLIMGMDMSIMSMFGMVGLAGVVVNDSLILVHAANRIRDAGASSYEAVTQAGGVRFRAIILTSMTTFAGLSPMLMEKSLQARFLIPMAVSLAFGVLFATGITLLLVPSGYVILDDIHRLIKWLFNVQDIPESAPE